MKLPRATRAVGGAVLVLGSLSLVEPVQATEYGFGDYGLGYGIPMSGYTPPPGVYFSDTFYLYSASATSNGNFPFGNITAAGRMVNFTTNIAAVAWYTDVKIFGGTLGFAAAVPVGSDTNSAAVSFIGPLGFNRQLNRTDSVVSIGDSAYSASLGWEAGEHHWNVALTGFAPTGHYAPDSLAIMGLNHRNEAPALRTRDEKLNGGTRGSFPGAVAFLCLVTARLANPVRLSARSVGHAIYACPAAANSARRLALEIITRHGQGSYRGKPSRPKGGSATNAGRGDA